VHLQIILGSTRPERVIDRVGGWVADRARAHPAFSTVTVLDLRDWPLPMFAEGRGTIGDRADPTYSDPLVRRWNQTIKAGDAFLMVTPEYLHSVPGVLKNALDSVFVSFAFRNKPAAFVGYSVGHAAGARAVEHLAHIAIECELVPLRNTVLIPKVDQAFGENGRPLDPVSDVALDITLGDLAWYAEALGTARAKGELPPAMARMMAAMHRPAAQAEADAQD